MTNDSLQQRQQAWVKLPEEIRALLSDMATVDAIEAIGAKHGLSPMEQGFLVRITSRLIMGTLRPTEFVREIEANIDVGRDKAAYIAQDINRDIFNKVKNSLKDIHQGVAPVAPTQARPARSVPLATPPPVPLAKSAPLPTPPPENIHSGSIFEQKLGGAFRIASNNVAHPEAGEPKLVVPPAPQAFLPPQPPQKPATSTPDPYRELG
jgi:hypothetical protein